MSTFARLVDGFALDCQEASSMQELSTRFHPDWFVKNPFISVPDGTRHGARDNGNGTFTNPPASAGAAIPHVLSASAFQDICETGLGGNSAGAARFGAIMRELATSQDDNVFAINQRFIKATTFDKQKTTAMLNALVLKAVITPQERSAILALWPVST